MKASELMPMALSSLKAIVKIALKSRRTVRPQLPRPEGDEVVILANGPSLRTTIAEHAERLRGVPTVAVNFMANAPEFVQLKPRYYVLADPHFFCGMEHDNVQSLWRAIASVDWPMTLWVPVERLRAARDFLGRNSKVEVATFNFIGIEGWAWLERMAYNRGWGMPRPRNVLVPALMAAARCGFKTIYVTGADHSWMETLRVDDDNNVVSVQPHFYADSKAETKRSVAEYRGYCLHDIIYSFYVAFSSYHRLQRWAESRGIAIYNATPDSFIDAFPRKDLQ